RGTDVSAAATHEVERADALVLFGITGDLAKKKLIPALYRMAQHDRLPDAVVGVARSGWDVDRLRHHIHESLEATGKERDPAVLGRIDRVLRYVDGDYREPATYQ